MTGSKKMTDMKTVLAGLIREKNWEGRLGMHAVFDFWDEVVGDDIAAYARPSLIRGTVLWLDVSDSVWMQQLQFQKNLLLEKINLRLTGTKLTDIRFQLDTSLGRPVSEEVEKTAKRKTEPDRKQRERLEEMLDSLADEDLKESMRRIWLKMQD